MATRKRRKDGSRGGYKTYDPRKKAIALAFAVKHGLSAAAREFKIPVTTLVTWRDRESGALTTAEEPPPEPEDVIPTEALAEVELLLFRGWSRSRILQRLALQMRVSMATANVVLTRAYETLANDAAEHLAREVGSLRQEARDRYARLFEVAYRLGAIGREKDDGKRAPPDPRFLRIAVTAADRIAEMDGVREPDQAVNNVQVNLLGVMMREQPEFAGAVDSVLADHYNVIDIDPQPREDGGQPEDSE